MSILERFIAVLAPHTCLSCHSESSLLCLNCRPNIRPPLPRCYRCRSSLMANYICLPCWSETGLQRVQAASPYNGLAKELIWLLKFSGAQAASSVMVDCLLPVELPPSAIIVPVPTATSRARQRGYDQAELLAKGLANGRSLPYARWLARDGQQHQRGASRAQRLRQLSGAFRVVKPRQVIGAHIVLVDDVVTTGASLQAATQALLQAGAATVEAVVFAQA